MKKSFFILVGLAVLAYFSYHKWVETPYYHVKSYVFGTLVDISIVGEDEAHARALADHILDDFQSLHRRLHAWKVMANGQSSVLQQLNQGFAQRQAVIAPPDVINMLHDIQALSAQSQGLFNPAIGALISTWGFQRDIFTAVEIAPATIAKLVNANPRMADIQITDDAVTSNNPVVQLDLGGYAKGFALDLAVTYLTSQHVTHALINIGGNIIAMGENNGRPWQVGIQHPRKPEALATIALRDGWAIGTSGDYQRYFELDDQRYCHLIDPNTGYPVQHTQAVTVLISPKPKGEIQAGVRSDVSSKPLFIAALPHKAAMAKRLGVSHYLVIDLDGNIHVSSAMLKELQWLAPNVEFDAID